MNGNTIQTPLQVLLVDDATEDLAQFKRDFGAIFQAENVAVQLDACDNFDEAFARAKNPVFRYDMVVSDTYEGDTKNKDAAVLDMVRTYRGARFCPLVVYSSAAAPAGFEAGPFILWADKGKKGDIEAAITKILKTGVPQLARMLHDEIDRAGSDYLWEFLTKNWAQLMAHHSDSKVLERLLRRRAAIQIGRIDPASVGARELEHIEGLEWYLYPRLSDELRLGEIIKKKNSQELRVVLTPHCYLTVQVGEKTPRAEFVLTVRMFPANEVFANVFGTKNAWKGTGNEQAEKLRQRIQIPANNFGKPNGRYCFLPRFLDIPDCYCDLLQLESLPLKTVDAEYDRVAVLDTPFAEALQSAFTRFYSAVGLPNLNPDRFGHLMEIAAASEAERNA